MQRVNLAWKTPSQHLKVLRHQDLQGAPVLIFANKQDLEGAVSAEEIGSALNLKELEERQSMAMAISAYDGSGIREGVTWLVDAMRTCKRTQELKQRADAAVTMNMHIIKDDPSVWRKERIKNRVW
ncbi:hypothetical protein Mapa_008970 [Marchantia paleacea]|nr:hypothetical protein Mapa_008970 [Marchantia paleacea]